MAIHSAGVNLSTTTDLNLQGRDVLGQDDLEQIIATCQHSTPENGRMLNTIGILFSEQKGDYQSAIHYHERALQIQEKNGEDVSDSLVELGFAYQNLRQFDVALVCHLQALSLREEIPNIDQRLIARSFTGIANAYWGQKNLSEALRYAQRALVLNESITSGNELNIATNLAILANIYHQSGDDMRALELAKRALSLLEHCIEPDSFRLVSLLNNIGTIQCSAGLFNDSILTFVRVLHICERSLPKEHPKRLIVIQNIERLTAMPEHNALNLCVHFWTVLTKLLLL